MDKKTLKKGIKLVILILAITLAGSLLFFFFRFQRPEIATKFIEEIKEERQVEGIKKPGTSALIENHYHEYQTFNNCGPATLSMVLNWFGRGVTQKELGDKMRPYQNPKGDNDDKTIFTSEFVNWAESYGFEAVSRRNGNIDLLKTLTANGIPVVIKTWLNVGEDIGHFRLVRGFDENDKVIIADDSYHGPNRKIPYYDLLLMWQPFNYDYMIVYTKEMEGKVKAILGSALDENKAWEAALIRAEKEHSLDPDNPYPVFNMATANFHLGNFQATIDNYEEVKGELPRRMLWYQIEPIKAYREVGKVDKALDLIENILTNGNRAFSELYYERGLIYEQRGENEKAKKEFELALFYNQNYKEATEALRNF